jgi:hypothetical protein
VLFGRTDGGPLQEHSVALRFTRAAGHPLSISLICPKNHPLPDDVLPCRGISCNGGELSSEFQWRTFSCSMRSSIQWSLCQCHLFFPQPRGTSPHRPKPRTHSTRSWAYPTQPVGASNRAEFAHGHGS